MSEPNTLDEISGEVRRFSAAMMAAIKRHSRASGWRERRAARKEISQVLRAEQRDQAQARALSLDSTNQAVDRYRAHAAAVADRAVDPSVDHVRRARDAAGLARHRDDLAGQFITNDRLTPIEQGMALDGLDAASVFPEYETGDLFGRAHKVKGMAALRYRAQVAREHAGMRQRAEVERATYEASLNVARRRNAERQELGRIEKAQPDQRRYRGELTWIDVEGKVVMRESGRFPTEHVATEWAARSIDSAMWFDGTTVRVQTMDGHHAATRYTETGRPEAVAEQLEAREAVLRERVLAGQVHRDQPQHTTTQDRGDAEAGRFSSQITYLPDGAHRVHYLDGLHGSEIEAAVWTHNQVTNIRPAMGTTVLVAAREREADGESRSVFRAEGGREFVADEVTQWWDGVERRGRDHAVGDGLVLESPESESVAVEPDQLRGEFDALRARHQLSIEHNGELTDQNGELTQKLAAMTAERDQLRGERDEAVRKLVERTPARERFGSAHRQAEQAKTAGTEQPSASPASSGNALADAMARNGHERDGIDR